MRYSGPRSNQPTWPELKERTTGATQRNQNVRSRTNAIDLTGADVEVLEFASEHIRPSSTSYLEELKSNSSYRSLARQKTGAHMEKRRSNNLNIIELKDSDSDCGAATDPDVTLSPKDGIQEKVTPIKPRSLPFPARPLIASFESHDGLPSFTKLTVMAQTDRFSDGYEIFAENTVSGKSKEKYMHSMHVEGKINPFLLVNCPWAGHGPEDDLSEQVIRNGLQEKSAVHNEFGSARSTLWPHLKPKTGLQSLSFLFTSALYRREEHGRISTASAFRPPPRITLGDTKREAWLLDLATESVPLRRLCRTIPHGIQGKQLIQECAARNVPIQRATWFARCVGANELRSFRRKGVTEATLIDNEHKWITEWTSAVELFVLESVSVEKSSDRHAATIYALRLSSRFFMENLLDKQHFVSWAIGQLQTCPLTKLPLFILLMRVCWENIIYCLDNACRFTTAALMRLQELSTPSSHSVLKPIQRLLLHTFRFLALHRLQHVLQSNLTRENEFAIINMLSINEIIEQASLNEIKTRTFYSTNNFSSASNTAILPELSLRTALEARKLHAPLVELSNTCRKCMPDVTRLVLFILQWASSTFSTKISRVYLAAKLLAYWHDEGLETDEAILVALPFIRQSDIYQPEYLNKIILELTKSGHFDCGRYIRRIIATGGLNRHDSKSTHEIQLLLHIPVHKVSSNIHGLRQMLLRSVRTKSNSQDEVILAVKDLLFQHMLCISTKGTVLRLLYQSTLIPSLTQSSLDQVSQWFRDSAISILNDTPGPVERGPLASRQERQIELFLFISRTLEWFSDYQSLATVLLDSLTNCQLDILMAALCIIELNLEIFAAMGVAQALCAAATDRYRSLRRDEAPSKDFINLLSKLSLKIKLRRHDLGFLKSESILCEDGLGVAAYTPASEELNDIKFTSGGTGSFDDLTPPAHIDASSLETGFQSIFQRITKRNEDNFTFLASLALCLRRWRGSNERLFDDKFPASLHETLPQMDTASIQILLLSAFDSDCLRVTGLIEILEMYFDHKEPQNSAVIGEIISTTLTMLLAPSYLPTPSSEKVFHKFRWQQQKYHSEAPQTLLRLFVMCACDPDFATSQLRAEIRTFASTQPVLSSLQDILMHEPAVLLDTLQSIYFKSPMDAVGSIMEILKLVVDPKGTLISNFTNATDLVEFPSTSLAETAISEIVSKIFKLVDVLSLPFFRLGLQILFSSLFRFPEEREALTDVLVNSAEASVTRGCSLWPQLIFDLDIKVIDKLRNRCERKLLSYHLMLPLLQSTEKGNENWEQIARLTSAIEATASSIPKKGCLPIANMIIECFISHMQMVEEQQFSSQNIAQEGVSGRAVPYTSNSHDRLKALLHITIIHAQSFQTNQNLALERLLLILCQLLVSQVVIITTETFQVVYDVTALFILKATKSIRKSVVEQLPPKAISDPHLRFLFGLSRPYDENSLRITSYSKHEAYPLLQTNSLPLMQAISQEANLSSALSDIHYQQQTKEGALSDKESSQNFVNPTVTSEDPVPTLVMFPMRRWEMLSDSTLNVGVNDTAISLRLFEARKI